MDDGLSDMFGGFCMICCMFARSGLAAAVSVKHLQQASLGKSRSEDHVSIDVFTTKGRRHVRVRRHRRDLCSRIADVGRHIDVTLSISLDCARMRATILATEQEPEAAWPMTGACYCRVVCCCRASWPLPNR
jgi:hypothetical protein